MTFRVEIFSANGEWAGKSTSGQWVPAVAGTLNQTPDDDETASTFASYETASEALMCVRTEMRECDESRIVEAA